MDKAVFIKKMKEDVLDTEMDIQMDTMLHDVEEWDSLSFVIFIAMAKTTYDRKVDRHAVAQAQSIRDLFDLLR